MKKLSIALILILIPLCVFASYDVTVRTGGNFDFQDGKTSIDAKNSGKLSGVNFGSYGLGFDAAVELDLASSFMFYAEVSMTLPLQVTIGKEITRDDVAADLKEAKEKDTDYKNHSDKTYFNTFSAHFGFAHRFDLKLGPWELIAGAGVGLRRTNVGYTLVKTDDDFKPYYYADLKTVTDLSVGLYGNFSYNITARLSATFTAIPEIGFFTIARQDKYEKQDESGVKDAKPAESSGFAFSYGFKASIGVSYTF